MKPSATDTVKDRVVLQEVSRVQTYLVRLEGREEVAEGTMAFRFEKPEGFRFKAGQAVTVGLVQIGLDCLAMS